MPNPPPTVGIDASRALVAKRTGTEHYSASLLRALAELPEAAQYNFVLYVNAHTSDLGASQSKIQNPKSKIIEKLGFELPPTWQLRAIPFPRLWTHARLSREMLTHPPDVLFVPSHVVPLWHPRRTVVTIHDLGYLYYPQAHTRLSRLYLHLSTMFSARAARRVIAISEATKRDLVARYKIDPRKIRVVHHGRDPSFAPVRDEKRIAETAARYGVSQPYCLHVGTIQPRKNLNVLVEAWSILRAETDNPPQLLLAGKRGWLYDSLFESVETRGLADLIKFADYVEQSDLPALYSGALAFTFPSLYEGFGLPPLEAMACGAPVLSSNTASLPEVVGDAGVLLDPQDAAAWADAVRRLMADAGLRQTLSQKGLARVKHFTWERCAQQTLDVLVH